MTRPSEAEVDLSFITGNLLIDVDACAMGTATESHYDVMARDLRERIAAALSTPPLPSGEPRDLSGYCVACGQEAGPHNTYGDAEGRHALNVYPNFSVCDSCLPSSDDTAPLTNEMEPEEAALRCWHNDFTGRCIPFEEIAEQLMRWTALRGTPPLPSAEPVEPCNWQTFGPGGPLQGPVRVCIHCGSLNESGLCQQTRTTPPAAAQDTGRLESLARMVERDDDGLGTGAVTIVRSAALVHHDGHPVPLEWSLVDGAVTHTGRTLREVIDNAMQAARAAGGE